MLAEQERQRAEAEAAAAQRREALEVAGRLRCNFALSLTGRSGKAHLTAVLQLLLTEHFEAWLSEADEEDFQLLAPLLDARLPEENDEVGGDVLWDRLVAGMRAALESRRTPDAAVGGLLAMLVFDRERTLGHRYGWQDASCLRYVRWLVAQGYEPTELERELLHKGDDDGE
jgi:hypothetical protein